ncbi:hypothetical protein AC739_18050 [Planococcus glaciei]|uniref:hypothetical protein n=1 Tax=Planococcus glaciei TaxID=459472 RepID=UPI00069EC244|nr:hypothetical protein [Planococcus glaciei]KOF08833.1 hypothetical protein AC739_18050 [Planococcus glaciei]
MSKFDMFSFMFFFIALIAQLIDFICSGSIYFYNHFLQWILLVIVVSPIIGFALGLYDRGRLGSIAALLNLLFFLAFGLLALLNFWILTFGK